MGCPLNKFLPCREDKVGEAKEGASGAPCDYWLKFAVLDPKTGQPAKDKDGKEVEEGMCALVWTPKFLIELKNEIVKLRSHLNK